MSGEGGADGPFLRLAVAGMNAIAYAFGRDLIAAEFRGTLDNDRKVGPQVRDPVFAFVDRRGLARRRGVTRMRFPGYIDRGGEALPVGRLAFKAREGRQTALSGFDSHSLPPTPAWIA